MKIIRIDGPFRCNMPYCTYPFEQGRQHHPHLISGHMHPNTLMHAGAKGQLSRVIE